MPKTDVILTNNVVGLGAESDHVKVAAGYARNYLFPQGLAIPLTSANKRQIEALKKRRVDREAKELQTMSELGAALSKLTLVLAVKTGEDGKMFGSVTAGQIADDSAINSMLTWTSARFIWFIRSSTLAIMTSNCICITMWPSPLRSK